MNEIIKYFAKQHTFVNLLTGLVLISGIYSLVSVSRDAFPNISFDMITVTTIYPNASAESVEVLITSPIESRLLEVEGVKEMSSVSIEGRSVITIKLDPDQVKPNDAEDDVRNIINKINDLPDGVEDPMVVTADTKTSALIEMTLGGTLSADELRTSAKRIKRRLERTYGVASVAYKGLPEYEIKVQAIPEKLRLYKVGLTELVNVLRAANVEMPAGNISFLEGRKQKEFVLKTRAQVESVSEIENVILRSTVTEKFIRVKDVARVSYGFADQDVWYRTNQNRGINLVIMKQQSADAIRLVDAVKSEVERMRSTLPRDLEYSYLNDLSKEVRNRINVLSNNLVVGLILVLLVLTIMLPFRIALVAAVGIPFSFLVTIMIFGFAGISLNLLSMMGLIIVLGMLVDDAIVVSENAQRNIDLGMNPQEAAIKGTQEIWKPVTTSVLTTLAAFIPLLLMSGIFGKFLREMSIGVVVALSVSLIECFLILPSHVASWVKKPKQNTSKYTVNYAWNHFVLPLYENIIKTSMRCRYLIIMTILASVIFTFWFATNKMAFVFFPGMEANNFSISFELAVGTTLEENENTAIDIENIIKDIGGTSIDALVTTVGLQGTPQGPRVKEVRGNQYARVNTFLVEERTKSMSMDEMVGQISNKIDGMSQVKSYSIEKGRSGPPVGNALTVRVISDDLEVLQRGIDAIKAELEKIKGVTSFSDSNTAGKEEVVVRIDEEALSLASLSKLDVANAVRATYDGIVADRIQKLDEEIEIRVTLEENENGGLSSLSKLLISNKNGHLIELGTIAKIERHSSLGSIQHYDAFRMVRIDAEVNNKIITSRELNRLIKIKTDAVKINLPGLSIEFGGEEQDRVESFQSLGKTFLVAILAIAFILMLQFGNIYQPIIIATIVPLGLLSVVWTFFFHNMPLNFFGIIGMIALAGVIVNNAIVFIDFVNLEHQKGIAISDAIVKAGKARLRPIFLTTITTVVGILPTAYGVGGIDQFVVPIALALGWGMFFGSILTTIVLPVLLAIANDFTKISVFKFNHKKS